MCVGGLDPNWRRAARMGWLQWASMINCQLRIDRLGGILYLKAEPGRCWAYLGIWRESEKGRGFRV